ncbi:MAG TPA: hypothetical protein VK783_01190 [Bacteroidia bacterium]|nr:hypothetical protein [Bacteroidia bacterium]
MKTNILFALAISTLLAACSKTTGPAGPQGPAGTLPNGTIDGIVTLYNEYGDKQPYTECTSVRVTLYNSSGNRVDSVNCDATGHYSITNVPAGDYTAYTRDTGYGQSYRVPFQFTGGGTIADDISLSHIPDFTFTISGDSLKKTSTDTVVVIYGTIAPASQPRNIAVFAGSSPTVSFTPGNYAGVYTVTVNANATTFSSSIALNSLYQNGLSTGTPAYFTVYAAAYNYASQSEYIDLTTGQTMYNALGASASAPSLKL